jgi:hypothetical protein
MPGLHELAKFVALLTGGDPVFSPKILFCVFVTSGKNLFPAKEAPAPVVEFSVFVAKFVAALTGGDPVFSPKFLFSLIVTSGKNFFTPKEAPIPAPGVEFSAFVAFALSQLTTSLNFS